jgi:hypothetical protein
MFLIPIKPKKVGFGCLGEPVSRRYKYEATSFESATTEIYRMVYLAVVLFLYTNVQTEKG